MYNYLLVTFAALAMIAPVQAQTPPVKVTDVMVTLTVKPGITRDQIVKVMHDEVSATVRLYLDGKIRQWYSARRRARRGLHSGLRRCGGS